MAQIKLYFAGSIRGGRADAPLYANLIEFLKGFGEVLTEHVGDPSLSEKGDDGPDDRYIHDRDMTWLSASDIIIAEVTLPSLGVGYELGRALSMGKPVLCLHRPDPAASPVRHDRRERRYYYRILCVHRGSKKDHRTVYGPDPFRERDQE